MGLLSALPLAILLTCYGPVLSELVRDWIDDPAYSHGFVVPLFSAYCIWQARRTIAALTPQVNASGMWLLLAGLGTLVLGTLAGEYFLSRASLVLVLAGLALFLLGRRVFAYLAFPIAYLLFMIPVPAVIYNSLAFPLQGLAARFSVWVLDRLSIPALLDGHIIRLSHMTLGVTEACSGLHSLVSLLALATAWSYLAVPRKGLRVLLVAAAVPIAIAANMLRVVLTSLLCEIFGPGAAEGFFHSFSGLLVFLVSLAALVSLSSLGWLSTHGQVPGDPSLAPGASAGEATTDHPVGFRHAALCAALLLVTVSFVHLRSGSRAVPLREPLETLPVQIGDWRMVGDARFDDQTIRILQPTEYLQRTYQNGRGDRLTVFVGYWETQRKGAMAHSPKNCLPGSGWEPIRSWRMELAPTSPEAPRTVTALLVQKLLAKELVLYWYQAEGRAFAGEFAARYAMVKSAVLRGRTDAALIRLSCPIRTDLDDASLLLAGFVQQLHPQLARRLPD